jgi:hypothetical protein
MNRIKPILIAFMLIASISIASAGTDDVSGNITEDKTWDMSGSEDVIRVTSDRCTKNASLTHYIS